MKGTLKVCKHFLEYSIIASLLFSLNASTSKKEVFIKNDNINTNVNLSTMALYIKENEQEREEYEAKQRYLWGSLDSYTGDLTGYEAYCPLCTGHLACMSNLDLSNGRTTYEDETYGEINIVASSRNLPCGSIIRFSSKRISDEPIIAIVLDRGVLGNDIDLLTESASYALKYVGRSTITYDVLRIGWKK